MAPALTLDPGHLQLFIEQKAIDTNCVAFTLKRGYELSCRTKTLCINLILIFDAAVTGYF